MTLFSDKTGGDYFDYHHPAWFANPAHVGVKKGDRAEIAGKEVFMASKLKKRELL